MTKIATGLVLLSLVRLGAPGAEREPYLGNESPLNAQVTGPGPNAHPGAPQQELHVRCIESGKNAERQAAGMVPGRTWTWTLNAQRSLRQLNGLRRALIGLKECEAAFEASLTPAQAAESQAQIRRMRELAQHLDRDVESLDDELRNKYPSRWHVRHDALDMRKEIQRWRQLYDIVAAALVKRQDAKGTRYRVQQDKPEVHGFVHPRFAFPFTGDDGSLRLSVVVAGGEEI